MTSLALVLWIAAAILLQIAVYLAIGFWNHWLEYRALRHRAEELNLPAPEEAPDEEFVSNVACWSGPRTFRQVECKKIVSLNFLCTCPGGGLGAGIRLGALMTGSSASF